jgi:uncharacterized protein (DUF427 family)
MSIGGGRPQRVEPGPGQESVWDYPRPPRLDATSERVRVWSDGHLIADSTSAVRVLETSQPPAYYLPLVDVDQTVVAPTDRRSSCEWKGVATYVDIVIPNRTPVVDAGWTYLRPTAGFHSIAGHLAFYPQLLECWVDDERVEPNQGSFYGGWITSRVVGPFKGAPGTLHW